MPTSKELSAAKVAALLGVTIGGGRATGKPPTASTGGAPDPNGMAKVVGQRMVFESRQAFRDQSWSGRKWPERYPNQGTPKVNIAGIVSDLRQGFKPPKRRFQARPVLEDEGHLFRSITYKVRGPLDVVVGSNLKYAGLMQTGGLSRQSVNKTVKSNLADFLKSLRGKKKKATGTKALIAQRLGFLFAVDQLETKIVPRTFLAVDERIEKALAKSLETYFDKFGQ